MSLRGMGTCVLAAGFLIGACKPESAQVGKDVGDAASDTQVLRAASADVNEMLRVADDCEAARPLMKKATTSVDEAARHVRTVTGQTTIDALRSQIKRVEGGCGS